MLVCYLTDEPSKIPAIRAALEPHHRLVPRLLGDKAPFGSDGVLMVDADLRVMARVEQIKEALSGLQCDQGEAVCRAAASPSHGRASLRARGDVGGSQHP